MILRQCFYSIFSKFSFHRSKNEITYISTRFIFMETHILPIPKLHSLYLVFRIPWATFCTHSIFLSLLYISCSVKRSIELSSSSWMFRCFISTNEFSHLWKTKVVSIMFRYEYKMEIENCRPRYCMQDYISMLRIICYPNNMACSKKKLVYFSFVTMALENKIQLDVIFT